jgi:hypothetical protein
MCRDIVCRRVCTEAYPVTAHDIREKKGGMDFALSNHVGLYVVPVVVVVGAMAFPFSLET